MQCARHWACNNTGTTTPTNLCCALKATYCPDQPSQALSSTEEHIATQSTVLFSVEEQGELCARTCADLGLGVGCCCCWFSGKSTSWSRERVIAHTAHWSLPSAMLLLAHCTQCCLAVTAEAACEQDRGCGPHTGGWGRRSVSAPIGRYCAALVTCHFVNSPLSKRRRLQQTQKKKEAAATETAASFVSCTTASRWHLI